ncbi:chemotaxis protein CheW [Pseudoteredinibacter isoporae]|uniref:Chemosensory pili system protein ChpC n=1 Tax=Pseudoteredinibacter isoporae TaxID=570281 RepID=A0A7X0MTT8_9GAMM|nr:chemotaxis protein CheW [Pseudoteredinibacter isoporae]MBB6519886.1 chemosensory pili system protein ChpC [Pseudoteredinibacter isoporae]NHO85464.1 chemotaxis protein CheW [Pseudoteredinibacter isoporae]NIB26084.1 chemotaxis protein CheW [Pseudoteredinibacter isoporae]
MEQLTQERPNEVPSLAVPVSGFTLLLPTISVAEMVPYRKSRFIPAEHEASGFLGRYEWRDQKVPLLSFEELNGLPRGEVSGYNQVAIINATGVNSELAYVAVIAQGIPHVARVTPEAIQELSDADEYPYVKMTVVVDGQEAVIPDVPALEVTAAEL